MTVHYLQWNYITVPSFMFRCVTVSDLRTITVSVSELRTITGSELCTILRRLYGITERSRTKRNRAERNIAEWTRMVRSVFNKTEQTLRSVPMHSIYEHETFFDGYCIVLAGHMAMATDPLKVSTTFQRLL